MSAKRTGRSGPPPKTPERAEGRLESYGRQEKWQRDGGDPAECLKSLSVCRDERPSPHRALSSGKQPGRSQTPMHAHASPSPTRSGEQSSPRTRGAPRPQSSTVASTTPSTACIPQSGSEPTTARGKRARTRGQLLAEKRAGEGEGGVKKVDAKASKPTSTPAVGTRTRPSNRRTGMCRIFILVHIGGDEIEWSLFIDSPSADSVRMEVLFGHDGEYHYHETRGLPGPPPYGLATQTLVTGVEVALDDLVLCVRIMVPMPPSHHPNGTRLWVSNALNTLVLAGLIDVNVDTVMLNAEPAGPPGPGPA